MKILNDVIDDKEYYQTICDKNLIVLHHTAGTGNPKTWWNIDPRKIATAFSISRSGEVRLHYKSIFHWAYHIGGRLLSYKIEQRSIGIELENWGILKKAESGVFLNYKFDPVVCPVTELDVPWRDAEFNDGTHKEIVKGKYFEQYPEVQIEATIELIRWILDQVPGIPRDIPANIFDLNRYARQYTGIVAHASLVSYKTDIHPGFPIQRLVNSAGLRIAE